MPVPSTEIRYKSLLKKIARNIRTERESRSLKQSDMPNFGFETRFYQRLESGEHSPSLYTLFKLARAFDCEISDLLCK